jgi:general secretion pathway protein D
MCLLTKIPLCLGCFLTAAAGNSGLLRAEDEVWPFSRDAASSAVREKTRDELMDEVGRSWRRAEAIHDELKPLETKASITPTAAKLETIVLPVVTFAAVPVSQVVASLSAASEEFDRSTSEVKGVNIVLLDPENRTAPVTLTLRNVSLKRALDFIAGAIGYRYEVQGDAVILRPDGEAPVLETACFAVTRATVLRMMGRSAESARASVSRKPAGSSPAQIADPETPDAETAAMKRFLQLAGVNFENLPGASLVYDGSAIIVTQTGPNLDRIRAILSRYREVRQVQIEAKFMEVREGVLEELGLNWQAVTKTSQVNAGAKADYATGNRTLADAFTSRSSSQQGGIVRPEATTVASDGTVIVSPELNIPIVNHAPQIPGSTDLAALAGPLGSVAGVIGEFDVNAVVRALSQQQGTDLLSAPKVTVLSGNPATITVAQEMRYPQSFGQTQSQVGTGNASGGGSAGVAITAGTPQDFTFRNVGVELRVTPTVEEDNHSISLDLNPKVTEFDGFVEYGGPSIAIAGGTTVTVPSGFYQPIFSVRDISTKVTVWDGATLVMGGLTREEVKKVQDKVPVLGDIPLLGRLFRSKGTTTQKRNLLIFVTASLVDPGGAPKRLKRDDATTQRSENR